MDGLQLRLELPRKEVIFGESIPFTAVISHTFREPVSVTALDPASRALVVFMRKLNGEERSADQATPMERDGLIADIPRVPEGKMLLPGDRMELKDDLLRWFGHIQAGTYRVWAEYRGILRVAVSEPVELKVSQAVILAANTPRWGSQSQDAPYTATWAHRHERGIMLFYQLQSPYLPRNPRHSIRAGIINEQVSAHAACLPTEAHPVGHLYWFTLKERFFFMPFDVRNAVPGPAVEVKELPFRGWPIPSGLSMKDGSLLVPFMDYQRSRCAVLHILPDGSCTAHDIDLGRNLPMGAYACFYEQDMRLHFLWTKQRGRQVDYAMLPLDDLEAGFASRTIHISNDPVLAFDAYVDKTLPFTRLKDLYLGEPGAPEVPEEEPPQPKVTAWVVTAREKRVLCTPVSVMDSGMGAPVAFTVPAGASPLTVINSVTAMQGGLCMLLADEGGRLFYASTMRKVMLPVEDIVGMPISQGMSPSLMRASTYPWVHLRFVIDARMIHYVRLEPEGEPDPVESETRPWDMEPEDTTEAPEEFDGEEEGKGDVGPDGGA